MNETRKKQIANVREAMKMWETVPPENVVQGLDDWAQRLPDEGPNCGTVACFGGWCAWWPEFRRQGVTATRCGSPAMPGVAFVSTVAARLFGNMSLFDPRRVDGTDGDPNSTDHEIVMHRLQRQLAKLEAMRGE